MKKFTIPGIAIILSIVAATAMSQSQEKPAEADRETANDQRWLKQFVGEWDAQWRIYMQPDQPPMESSGSDSVRMLGNNWIIAEANSTMMGAPFSGILSLGYDAQKQHFHGTWIDSFSGHMWIYKGTLNDAGDTLTLETEGPSLEVPGETAQYREVIHIKNGTRTFNSSYQATDGRWIKIVEIDYRRKDTEEASDEQE